MKLKVTPKINDFHFSDEKLMDKLAKDAVKTYFKHTPLEAEFSFMAGKPNFYIFDATDSSNLAVVDLRRLLSEFTAQGDDFLHEEELEAAASIFEKFAKKLRKRARKLRATEEAERVVMLTENTKGK